MLWRFRVTLLVPANSDLGGGDVAMNAYIATQLAILYGVVGLRVESVGPTGVAQWAGSDVLAADIAVSTYVQLA